MKPLTWRKSRRSDTEGNACVEMADLGEGRVGIRDSKNPGDGHFALDQAQYRGLVNQIKRGDLNFR